MLRVILLTCTAVLFFTCSAFFAYEVVTFRATMLKELVTLGQIIASNSTAALAFDSRSDANETLEKLRAQHHIVSAALYDGSGALFAQYPHELSAKNLPEKPSADGYNFDNGFLSGFQAVGQGNHNLGTLYLKADMSEMKDRFVRYGLIELLVACASFLVAYFLSGRLQRRITMPIIELASAAKSISEAQDYTVRARQFDTDELGSLTSTFNEMIAQIEEKNTEISKNRDRLENIMQTMGDAFVSLNRKWEYTFVNERAIELMVKNKEALLGNSMWEVFPDIVGTTFDEEYHKVMDRRESASFETFYPSYNMWLHVRAYPNADGISIFYTDITREKNAEDRILQFNQELEVKIKERTEELQQANHELESFSYSVSHDLRAPLRSIHGYMNIFAEDYKDKFDEEGERYIEIIMRNAKKMGMLIDDLLEFSRLGRGELTKVNVKMTDMVKDLWEELRKNEDAGRKIELTFDKLIDAPVDHATIKQVWLNLISNALKYTRQKEVAKIEIGSSLADGSVTYYIKDNGAGFDMKYYAKLFGVFQRLHSQEEFEGTGVGLAIIQRIVNRHGGKVWAEAQPDVGAAFYFSIAGAAETTI